MKEGGISIMLREQVQLQGKTIAGISRETGMSRNTIRKYLRDGEKDHGLKGQKRPSKLDPSKSYIDELTNQGVYNAQVIYERLVDKGYQGKITIIKDYLHPLRPLTVKETFREQTR